MPVWLQTCQLTLDRDKSHHNYRGPWTAVPLVRNGMEQYVVRIFGTRFFLVQHVERISDRNLLIRYGVRILVRDFYWYGMWSGMWYKKSVPVRRNRWKFKKRFFLLRSGTDYFVKKSVPRTVPGSSPKSVSGTVLIKIRTENPYHVPFQRISYQKPVPHTKIRTGFLVGYGHSW